LHYDKCISTAHSKTPRTGNKTMFMLDSELYRCKPELTYAISGNVVGGVSEFSEKSKLCTKYEVASFNGCSYKMGITIFWMLP